MARPGASAKPRLLALLALLGATLAGTLANNILNVPLRAIAADFHAGVSAGVLVVGSFVLVLAAGLVVTGWVCDRFGRRRVLVAGLGLMSVATLGAAVAPTFGLLVASRAVQGAACAVFPPAVMAILSTLYSEQRRPRVMSAWAAANGLGQAVGPPLGGLLADLAGWRAIFWVLAPLSAGLALAAWHAVPSDGPRRVTLHWPGAASLTLGAALVMSAVMAVPQLSGPGWPAVVLAIGGVALIALFVVCSVPAEHPIVRPQLIVESRFLRSSAAAGSQMFCLGCTLVAVPLYMTGALGRSAAVTGLYVLALPATMALLAPVAGRLCDSASPRSVLRGGLLLLAVAELALGWYLGGGGRNLTAMVIILVAVGAGIALVQTPAATGATRSAAGRDTAALGLFNMLRFAGSGLGAAWVAIVYPHGALLVLFLGCAGLAAAGFAVSFAGPDPAPLTAHRQRITSA